MDKINLKMIGKPKRKYKDELTVDINAKGVIDLDTVKGCTYGIRDNPNGCWGICYAKKIATIYGIDFSKSVSRRIKSVQQMRSIARTIMNAELDFVRIGTMGDPSHDWGNTIQVCEFIKKCGKDIVIVTKHWIPLTDEQMEKLGEIGVIINTSVSALSRPEQREYRLNQYERYKEYGLSVLRIVSCDFNVDIEEGKRMNDIQKELFKKENIIDNPLRLNKKYPLYEKGIIKAEMIKDLNSYILISRFNPKTYIGHCSKCPDQCGLIYKKNYENNRK